MVSKFLALGLCALATVVLAYEEIRIVAPIDLATIYKSKGLDNRPALFGVPPYGLSITGPLVTPAADNWEGCNEHDRSLKQFQDTGSGIILFVKRGTCTFVTKVRNAQNVGAKAVLIVNNEDDTHPLPFMADDGSGGSLATPSLIISQSDGSRVNYTLTVDNKIVVVSMSWGIPHPNNIVEWSFWTSSKDPNSDSFKEDFSTIIESFGNMSVFTPRYYFLRGEDFGCVGSAQVCGNQCTNGGRYCAVDPEHDVTIGISGADVVRENLRQICVFKYANSTTPKNVTLWWDYANMFDSECAQTGQDFSIKCSKDTLAKLRLPAAAVTAIESCITASGGYEDSNGENTLIKAEIEARIDQGVYVLPTIIINNAPYRGSLYCPQPVDITNCGVLSAICAGYAGDEPDACTGSNGCPIGQVRDECGNCGGDGTIDACGNCLPQNHPDRRNDPDDCNEVYQTTRPKGVSAGTVFLIVFVFVSVVAIGFFYLHRRSQASMRRELADIMQQYVPLGTEDGEHTGAHRVPSALDTTS